LRALCEQLLAVYPAGDEGCHRLLLADGRVTLDLWVGDIEQQLPHFVTQAQGQVDRWFLDGFAPAKNPQMWQSFLFSAMATTAHQGTRYATFTAAGVVKRGLQGAGFTVAKVKGFGRKRDMLCGALEATDAPQKASLKTEPVAIIGGGIAAACLSLALQRRGVNVTVSSRGQADAASGNPQGAVYPLLHAEKTPLSQFYLHAFSTAVSAYLPWREQHWFPTGVLQPSFNEQRQQRFEKVAAGLYDPQTVSLQPAGDKAAGLEIGTSALHYARAGWLRPATMVKELFNKADINVDISARPQVDMQQKTVIAAGHCSAEIIAALSGQKLSISPVRGQITQVEATDMTASLNQVLCYKGYMVPADNGLHCIGATFNRGDDGSDIRTDDDSENLANLKDCAQQPWANNLTIISQRASVRATTPNHQPMIGQVQDNLYVFSGLGSRGLTSAPLLAEILAAQLTGGLQPLSSDALKRLQPR
jgi:tRNA 5-methylaminomethyl-2-thiouridine biosynthesis bifunctional protein